MTINYDGLTRNQWPGTWSPSADHPIVLDKEIRGGLRSITGAVNDRLTDITGQRLEDGMMVYLKSGYTDTGTEFLADRYYRYKSLPGESRNSNTGALPNSTDNWSLLGDDIIDLANINTDILPDSNFQHDLGSNDRRWKGIYAETLYLGTSTIFLGSDKLNLDAEGNLLINDKIAFENLKFYVAADDSTVRTINAKETIKFSGSNGITTASDDEGNITITGTTYDLSPYATTAYVDQEISDLLADAPAALDTLRELADALGNDQNFSVSIVNLLATKLDKVDQYKFKVAGDDSAERLVGKDETVKFIGGVGISTYTDSEGNVLIDGFSGSYDDLTGSPPLSPVSLSGSYKDLTDQPYIPQDYSWSIAADDSTERLIGNGETVKFIGGSGITTQTDDEGNVTIDGFSGDYQDLINIPPEFTFKIQSDNSAIFTVKQGSNLRLSGNLNITIEEDSSEGLVISGPDFQSFNQSIIPDTTEVYDLGSPDKRWKDLYLSGNSISIGSITISTSGEGNLSLDGAESLSIGATTIEAADGKINLPSGSTLNGSPLLTSIELIENAFRLDIVGDDSTGVSLASGDSLKIQGEGGSTTRVSEDGNLIINSLQFLGELTDVTIDENTLSIGKILRYDGTNWVASNESGSPGAGSGSGDAATLNGFDGTHYLNYNNLTNKPDPYSLPPATTTTLGGVIVGENINVNNGVISVPKGAGINKVVDIPDVYDDNGLPDGAILSYNIGAERWETQAIDLSNSVMDGGFY